MSKSDDTIIKLLKSGDDEMIILGIRLLLDANPTLRSVVGFFKKYGVRVDMSPTMLCHVTYHVIDISPSDGSRKFVVECGDYCLRVVEFIRILRYNTTTKRLLKNFKVINFRKTQQT